MLNFAVLARFGRGEPASLRVRIAAVLSMLAWPSVLVAGRFIGFVS